MASLLSRETEPLRASEPRSLHRLSPPQAIRLSRLFGAPATWLQWRAAASKAAQCRRQRPVQRTDAQQQSSRRGHQHAHATHAGVPATDHAEGLPAPAAADRRVLPHGVHRSHQRLLCRAHHEPGPGPDRLLVRPGRRHLLPRLCAVRSAEQHGPAPSRRARVDRADHDHVGHHLRLDGRCHRARQLPRAALSAGRGRGRVLPGHRLLPHLLVSVRLSGPSLVDPVPRCAGLERGRVDPLRRHSRDGRHARPQGLAMGVHHRGDPRGPARLRRPVADDRAPGPGGLARRRRARVARSRAARPSAAGSRAPGASPSSRRSSTRAYWPCRRSTSRVSPPATVWSSSCRRSSRALASPI